HTRYWRDWSSDVCSSDLGCCRGFVLLKSGAEDLSPRHKCDEQYQAQAISAYGHATFLRIATFDWRNPSWLPRPSSAGILEYTFSRREGQTIDEKAVRLIPPPQWGCL